MPDQITLREMLRAGAPCEPQHLSGMDVFIGHAGSPCVMVFPQGLPAEAMAESLKAVLAHYPVFTGRYRRDEQGHVFIDGQDAGVPYTVHQHRETMPAWGMDRPIGADMPRWFQRIYPWRLVNTGRPPMAIEVHRFACGGALLSVTAAHSLCDGSTFWAFMMDWARKHHGADIAPAVWDRNRFIQASEAHMASPPWQAWLRDTGLLDRLHLYGALAWQHWRVLADRRLRLSGATLSRWQQEAAQACPEAAPFSSAELATAWVLRALSSGMPRGHTLSIGHVLDLRHRSGLGLHRRYVGNALGRDVIEVPGADLAQTELADVARRCRMRWDRIPLPELQAHLGWLEGRRQAHRAHRLTSELAARSLTHGVLINNCGHFPAYKIDFGSGPPSWHETERPPYRRILLAPSAARDGGLDLQVTARRSELSRLPAV